MHARWSVMAVYANATARQTAVSFCEQLVKRFWTRCDFDVTWLSFDEVADAVRSQETVTKAAKADLMVFATPACDELPWHIKAWIEQWLERRHEREGTLVTLRALEGSPVDTPAHRYLREIAHRAGMDFLTELPENIHEPFADTPEVYTARAKQVTSVLDDILHRTPPRSFD